jgi:hypothetical protein
MKGSKETIKLIPETKSRPGAKKAGLKKKKSTNP